MNSLDIRQRLAGELQDICRRADENQEELRELVAGDSASERKQPFPQDEEDEQDLMKRKDPVVGTNGWKHLVDVLKKEAHSYYLSII